MFTVRYPIFQRGRILKLGMLESLRDYPRHVLDIHYQDYSDGIITGANVMVNEDHLTITKGIVKHQGCLYLLPNDFELPYLITGNEAVVKIRFQNEKKEGDFVIYEGELVLDEQIDIQGNEVELARYKLKKGAHLRSDYQDFEDFSTEFNTLNVIHSHYAGVGESTIHPIIMRYFSREVMRCGNRMVEDTLLAMMCLNEGTVEREVLLHYLAHRLGTEYKAYTNIQIHKYFVRILNELYGGHKARFDLHDGGRQRIIVD